MGDKIISQKSLQFFPSQIKSSMENQNPVPKHPPKVLVFRPPSVFPIFEQQYSDKFQFLKPWESPIPTEEFLETHASCITVMLTRPAGSITADIIRRLPLLRLIVTTSVGLDHIDLLECRRRGIAVAGAGTIFSEDVADMAVGLLIDVLRRISASGRYVRAGLWPLKGDYPLGTKLGGKRVGIIGLGNIGLEVSKRLQAFGCSISYTSRTKKASISFPFYQTAIELAANCDILVICCMLTEQTRHMVNKEVLKALGKDGVVINIARGGVIEEKELVRCLVDGEIAGAGLDVFEKEPGVPEELFTLDNVVMSPHSAVFTEEAFADLCELLAGNLEAFFSNKPLLSQVAI